MKKKRAFTLLEIMIVIFLIGLIGSIIGFNMKGSLDKGKVFKTEQAMIRLRDILELELAKGSFDATAIQNDALAALEKSGMVKESKKLLKDAWGKDFGIQIDEAKGEVVITSEGLVQFYEKHPNMRPHEEDNKD